MATDAPLGRTRWLDPDSATVTDALRAYHGTDEAWREPYRTKQGENDERFRMALALETALPEPKLLTDDEFYDQLRQAERIVRPFLTTAALFGVCPDHRFRNREEDAIQLVHDIMDAIEAAREASRKEELT